MGGASEATSAPDYPVQDTRDADALYALLQSEVVPSFYAGDAGGIPRAWIRRIRASLRSIAPMFSTARMLTDYARDVYAAPRAR